MAMPATSATRRADSTAPSCQKPWCPLRSDERRAASGAHVDARRAAGRPRATRRPGTSTWRERSNSPRPFACVSRRRFEATPQPRMPCTTKLTAHRFGRGWRSTANGTTSGRSAAKEIGRELVGEPAARSPLRRPRGRRWRRRPCRPSAPRRAPRAGRAPGRCRRRPTGPVARPRRHGRRSPGAAAGARRDRGRAHRECRAVALDDRQHRRRGDRRRPVARHALGPGGRRGEEGARIARQAGLDDGTGEGAADRLLVVAAHGQAEVRHAATGQVAREILRRLGEGAPPAGDPGPHRLGGEAGPSPAPRRR